jgi:nucleoside-diphosphate-sugar epimerase
MRTLNILIAGCGYVGTALGERLAADGHTVWGLRRQPHGLPPGVTPLAADLADPATLNALPQGLDVVFYTAAADGSTDDAYRLAYVDGLRHLLTALADQRQRPRRVFLTSSTGVYAQYHGEWVDESSPTEPVRFTGKRLLEGERLLLESPFPATVVRLGGIYGPGRARLIDSVRQGTASYPDGPAIYVNRIHRDDCAGALRRLMLLAQPAPLYLGVDYDPADRGTVLRWLAAYLGAPPPRIEPMLNPEALRTRSNKRCRNTRLVASGYTFLYPNYRKGYAAILAADDSTATRA